MPVLSWNEIRERAYQFVKEWDGETNEHAEAKSFYDAFFHVFGISRRRTAHFELRVHNPNDRYGYIDLLWKGVLLVEHKSKGKDLERAHQQAKDYSLNIQKDADLPRYILVSDFERFRLYDLENESSREFRLPDLPQNIELFSFMIGYQKEVIQEQDPVNIHAAEKMGEFHDKLKAIGYTGHDLEVYLVRILFCLFADDTGIFEKNIFKDYVEFHTQEDGSDLAGRLEELFEVLNTPEDGRLINIDENLDQFPYVNGDLFAGRLRIASFDASMRQMLLDSSKLDWSRISPAVFGSLFQSVMDREERRSLGAHYTTEENIMKVIKPLFLDDLWVEFHRVKRSKKGLEAFHEKIAGLYFLDPACGCGNFLIIAYRELRLLELEILREQLRGQMTLEISFWVRVDVDQFYGVEINDFASQIAQLAMWLIDHQMNMRISQEFGQYFVRLPLLKRPNIIHGNALQMDWKEDIVSPEQIHYILGNPPFVGSSLMSGEQKADMKPLLSTINNPGALDYVTGWYIKAASFIEGTRINVAFVSTNSVTQGEQALVIWEYLMQRQRISINFAHQTFKWLSETRDRAAVYCVIIGFSRHACEERFLYTYPDISVSPTLLNSKNINQYLLDAPTIFIEKRREPLSKVSPMIKGSQPTDGGFFLFTETQKNDFIIQEPKAERYFRPWVGANELLNGSKRYCLYIANCPPNQLRKMPLVLERVQNVQNMRYDSKKKSTRRWGDYPKHLTEDRTQNTNILVIPSHTSENRGIIPIAYLDKSYICSNAVFQIPNASPYLFGILNSAMHMAWMRTVCGRLKGDYRYSNTLVYNNFVFPDPTDNQIKDIERKAQTVLEVRKRYPESTLSDLYSPLAMPGDLLRAHRDLDKAVDRAYAKNLRLQSDNERASFMFEKYKEEVQGV